MRKINKVLIGLTTPLMPIATMLPLVSCGGPVLTPTITCDEHVNSDGISVSKIQQGKSFTISASNPKQYWKKISATVTVGDHVFEADRIDDLHLTVPGNKVNDDKISIAVKGEGTFNRTGVSWVNETYESTPRAILHVGETIRKSDIWVWAFYGDDEDIDDNWRQLEPGTGSDQYQIWFNDKEITSTFPTDGYTITNDDLIKKDETYYYSMRDLGFKYVINGTTYIKKGDIYGICCKKLTSATITPASASVEKGASQDYTISVNEAAYPYFKFQIYDRTGASDTTLSTTQIGTTCTVVAGQEAGSVTIRAVSVDDPTFYKDATFNIA